MLFGARMRAPRGGACATPGGAACGPTSKLLVLVDHAVDEPVLDGLIGLEEAVALHVLVDLLLGLPGVVGVDLVGALADVENLSRVDLDDRLRALEARRRRMDQLAAGGHRDARDLRPPR